MLLCLSHTPFFFFFNDTATTEIYTLSLHDALPIFVNVFSHIETNSHITGSFKRLTFSINRPQPTRRSEERFSRNAETDLVCRLLLEKKKTEYSRREINKHKKQKKDKSIKTSATPRT